MTDFEQIYKDYFRDVFLYVRRLSGGDERLAEDITSEAFFRALRRIDSFRGGLRHPGVAVSDRKELLLYPSETKPLDRAYSGYGTAYIESGGITG